jgi:hypothetical protein
MTTSTDYARFTAEQKRHSFSCQPACSELRLLLRRVSVAARLRVNVERNDRYRVSFYHNGELIDFQDCALDTSGKEGTHVVELRVSDEARREGYDSIGIMPLYGDGHYTVGSVTPVG